MSCQGERKRGPFTTFSSRVGQARLVLVPLMYLSSLLQYNMQASFLEIYNETIRDLLTSQTSSKASLQHDIKLDPSLPGGVHVTNVTPTPVRSQAKVAQLLRQAAKNRAVAATNCNERSSRSHSVFRLELLGNNEITGEECKGQWTHISQGFNSDSIRPRFQPTSRTWIEQPGFQSGLIAFTLTQVGF